MVFLLEYGGGIWYLTYSPYLRSIINHKLIPDKIILSQKIKEKVSKYILELLIIVSGISLSFYVDNYTNDLEKSNLKNQSLKRILKNLEIDIIDNKFNQNTLLESVNSSKWILSNQENLIEFSRDTIGFHFNKTINHISIFVDNQEEYRTLQSSGYIELIGNEKLVELLQNKYAQHNFMKKLEEIIIKKSDGLTDFDFKNLKYTGDSIGKQGFLVNKRFTGKLDIPNEVFERIFEAAYYRNYYIDLIKKRLVQDSLLKIEIKKEIKL